MIRRLFLCVAPLLLVASASADPIRYTTGPTFGGEDVGYTTSPLIRFESTEGTFEPGSTISLGRFIIDAPEPGSSTILPDSTAPRNSNQFVIALRAPDFDEPDLAAPYPATKFS